MFQTVGIIHWHTNCVTQYNNNNDNTFCMSCMIPDFQAKVSQSAFLEQFNDIVTDVPAEDMYYLLQTFASMALSREMNDIDFIRCVTTDLFKV